MKKFTKIIAVLLVSVLMIATLAGCGENRELYKRGNLKKYVEVDDYLGIEIDTKSDKFKEYYDVIYNQDVEDNNLYVEEKEGAVVKDGYIANIDYEGKIDGVAFSGGTAKGYNLKIGSQTFIDDFEEELIGVAVGETKDVTAKFPDDYSNNPDLAGKEAVFTCKVNYVGRPMTVVEAYSTMKFSTAKAYEENIIERAAKDYIFDEVCKNAKIKGYPEKDLEILGEAIYEVHANDFKAMYNMDLEQLIIYNGKTVEGFKKEVATEYMNTSMIMYYIFDEEDLELYESTVDSQEVEQTVIAESYAVQNIVLAHLFENAKIK